MSVNKVILIGNVGKAPESRSVSGNQCVTFSLATTERGYTKADGTQMPERTEWHTVEVWRKLGDTVLKYVTKGMSLYVEGKMSYRSWTDQQGVRHDYATVQAENIEFLSRGSAPQQSSPSAPPMP